MSLSAPHRPNAAAMASSSSELCRLLAVWTSSSAKATHRPVWRHVLWCWKLCFESVKGLQISLRAGLSQNRDCSGTDQVCLTTPVRCLCHKARSRQAHNAKTLSSCSGLPDPQGPGIGSQARAQLDRSAGRGLDRARRSPLRCLPYRSIRAE